MSTVGEKILLRIYTDSADRTPHMSTHERLIEAAQKEEMAGAVVIQGILGSGYHGIIKERNSLFSLVDHVPTILEIVDEPQKIARFVTQTLSQVMQHGMVTIERAAVIMNRRREDQIPENLQLFEEKKPLSTVPKIQPGTNMTINENGILLRVFIGESDTYEKKPLYEQIVQKARELGLAGATVLRGSEGFGANSVMHTSRILVASTDLPIIIEIVDEEAKIKSLLPSLQEMVQEGMITMEYVMVVMYRHNPEDADAKQMPTTPEA